MNVLDRGSGTVPGSQAPASPPPPHRRRRWLWWLALGLAVLAGALAFFILSRAQSKLQYVTQAVVRKTLVQLVTASGTVNPQNVISVGTQVSGTISELDADFNSRVKAGQILARIDPTSLQAALAQAKAASAQAEQQAVAARQSESSSLQNVAAARQNVAAAREALASAQSQVEKARSALDLARLTLSRDHQLLSQGYVAQSQVDTDASNEVAAEAALSAAQIAVPQAQAQLAAQVAAERASEATAKSAGSSAAASEAAIGVQRALTAQASYNVDHSVITSPVDGTVIARNVSIGQTVAASFQTPTLFTIAQDLSKMEVDIAAGEPDIGGIRDGQEVDFTVLAYPNRTFHGTVYQVRQNPTTVNNVVTYDTVVYVENRDGALRPGMTANALVHVAKVEQALVVPVAALQWVPAQPRPRASARATVSPASPWGITQASLTRTIVAGREGGIFVVREGKLARVPVQVLLVSDTEAAVAPIRNAKLAPGDTTVIADVASAPAQAAQSSSALTRQSTAAIGGGRPGGGAR